MKLEDSFDPLRDLRNELFHIAHRFWMKAEDVLLSGHALELMRLTRSLFDEPSIMNAPRSAFG